MAFDLIQGAGLEAVYTQPDRKWKAPVEASVDVFHVFDQPEFLDRRAPLDSEGLRSIELGISGLMCSSCIYVVEKLPRFVPEIRESRVDYGRGRVFLRFENKNSVLFKAAEILARLGYQLSPESLDLRSARIPKLEWLRLGITGLSAAGAMHIGLVLIGAHGVGIESSDARLVGFLAGIAAIPALTFGAWPFFRSTIQNLKWGAISADLLVSLAILLGSLASFLNALRGSPESYFDALAMIVFLLLGGRILVRLSTLMAIQRPLWMARQNGRWTAAETLAIGDSYQMEGEDLCPADSILKSQEAWFDLSSLTGESVPVRIFQGQQVCQGSKALSPCELEVIQLANGSSMERLGGILRSQSWQSLPPIYEGIFTIIIVALGVGVLLWGGEEKFSRALAILIVTCPCALQLARPLVMTSFKRQALQSGIMIFQPDRILQWESVKDVYLDKTGTLTKGSLALSHVESTRSTSESAEVLNSLIYDLAKSSEHPISRSLALAYYDSPRRDLGLSDFEHIPGMGITASYQNRRISLRSSQSPHTLRGVHTSLFIGDSEVMRFYFSDTLRTEVAETLKELKVLGLRLHLLSGDRQQECERLGAELNLFESITGDQSPEGKAKLQSQASAFVGDGVNDVLAMRAAGVSVGFSGSAEASLQAADCYILNHHFRLVPNVVRGARRASGRIRNLLSLSLFYNVLCIGLIFAGVLGPIVCAIFMPLSSLSVIVLAARTTYFQNASL